MKPLSGRLKTCRVCGHKFKPDRTMQQTCNIACALELAGRQREKAKADTDKAERKAIRAAKTKLLDNDRSHWLKKAQTEFNAWVRLRDADQPCISCGRHHQGQYHAGHFRTVGSNPALRFEPLNCHKQCAPCNNHKSGNIVEYRISLLAKIGPEKLAWLEGQHEPKKYSIDDLKQIAGHYRKLRADLEKLKA